jgi:F-type H+-transporting ATPase subunit b
LTQQLADLDQQRQEIIRKAREQADAERKTLAAEAELTIRHRREEVERQLELDRDEALQSLQGELVASAVALAERFLKEAAGSSLQERLAGRLVEALRTIPVDQRQQLSGEWESADSAVLETATDVNGELLTGIRGAVESLAGRPMNLAVQVKPELLGGVRLKIGGHVWDASLADGLPEVRSAALPRTAP